MTDRDQLFRLAVAACQHGAFDVAEHQFKTLLVAEPNHIGALNLLGLVLAQVGKLDEAERVIDRAVKIGPPSDAAHFNHAVVLKNLKRLPEALAAFDRALALNPNAPDTLNNRGSVLNELHRFQEALSDFERAIQLKVDFADAHYNMGNALLGLNRREEALESFHKAIKLNPNHAGAYNNRGMAYLVLSRFEEALADFDRGIVLKPDLTESYVGRGDALVQLKQLHEALAAFDRALIVNPDLVQAWLGRGTVFSELKRYDDASAACDKALAIDPGFATAWLHRGNLLLQRRRDEDALSAYDRALAIDPQLAEAWRGRSLACKNAGHRREAIDAFNKYMQLDMPLEHTNRDHYIAIASQLFGFDCLPPIYADTGEIEEKRHQMVQSLDTIHAHIDAILSVEDIAAPATVIDSLFLSTGFYVAYQQENDVDLMRSYSLALRKILKPTEAPRGAHRRASDRIRFGIASERLRNNNGARWAYDWLCQLPSDTYEFFSYAFHDETDEITSKFAKLGSFRRLPFGPKTFAQAVETMTADRLDILMLPDVGMTASSRILSQYRIAPIQFTAWGHPVTTGSSNIDFFLSSDLMEPEDAQNHYSEKLVRLPHLALYLEPGASPCDPAATFDLPADRVLFGALQSLYKYLPQYDLVYPQIAKKVPSAFFVFIESELPITTTFAERLAAAFARENLDANNYVRFLPRMDPNQFSALCKTIHASIDSIGWSGGNTTIQCLEMDCPVVTLPGPFMRGRHSAAMLTMIGLEELIAESLPDFVDKAARLGDQLVRTDVAKKIAANNHKLYRDRSFIEALDAFLKAELLTRG